MKQVDNPCVGEPQPTEPRPVVEYEMEPVYPYRPRRISPATFDLTGFTPEEYLDNPTLFAVRLHPDDLARVMSMYREVTQAGTATAEYRFMHKAGGYRWMRDEIILSRCSLPCR